MATPSLNLCNRAEKDRNSALKGLKQRSFFFPPAYTNSRRHLGQERQRPHRRSAVLTGSCLLLCCSLCFALCCWFLLQSCSDCLAVGALDGALNFCCREEKEGRLSERSEFASPPSLRHKFKESFAISGAPFFGYFLWQDKESDSAPAGDETRDAPPKNDPPQPHKSSKPHRTRHTPFLPIVQPSISKLRMQFLIRTRRHPQIAQHPVLHAVDPAMNR
ncbi:hypothetical protein R77567_02924 [Ralstonia sp. LMG 32965]|uniref:Transmembrane protein n=1 Tax=Ralstonia flatus TaxID=3058601 RepID=A0AAD2F9H5_9RALS|nr:hypothetical protein R77567_02924 [Ralstonia sp. LMG 32965]CAJ0880610.1 hypothetical protein R77564_02585 [Ralstonia sp. LMG 32965]